MFNRTVEAALDAVTMLSCTHRRLLWLFVYLLIATVRHFLRRDTVFTALQIGKDDVDGVDMAYRVVADHIRTLSFSIAGTRLVLWTAGPGCCSAFSWHALELRCNVSTIALPCCVVLDSTVPACTCTAAGHWHQICM